MAFGDFYKDIMNKNTKFFLCFSFSIFFCFITNVVIAYPKISDDRRQTSLISLRSTLDDVVHDGCSLYAVECDRRKIKDHCLNLIPITSQEKIPSCWAHSTASHFSLQNCMATGETLLYSPIELAGCKYVESGRYQGTPEYAFNYIYNKHWSLAKNYHDTYICDKNTKNDIKIKKFYGFYDEIQNYATMDDFIMVLKHIVVTLGSFSTGIYAGTISDPYFKNCISSDLDANHEIPIVGWTKEKGIDYWIFKNSWGDYYGEKGYGKLIMRDQQCPQGHHVFYRIYFLIAEYNNPKENFYGFPPVFPFRPDQIFSKNKIFEKYYGNKSYDPVIINDDLNNNPSQWQNDILKIKKDEFKLTSIPEKDEFRPTSIPEKDEFRPTSIPEKDEFRSISIPEKDEFSSTMKRKKSNPFISQNDEPKLPTDVAPFNTKKLCRVFDVVNLEPNTNFLCKNVKSRFEKFNDKQCIKICEAYLEYCTIHPEYYKDCLSKFISENSCIFDSVIPPINRMTKMHLSKTMY